MRASRAKVPGRGARVTGLSPPRCGLLQKRDRGGSGFQSLSPLVRGVGSGGGGLGVAEVGLWISLQGLFMMGMDLPLGRGGEDATRPPPGAGGETHSAMR